LAILPSGFEIATLEPAGSFLVPAIRSELMKKIASVCVPQFLCRASGVCVIIPTQERYRTSPG
jgi:hypothetical protein